MAASIFTMVKNYVIRLLTRRATNAILESAGLKTKRRRRSNTYNSGYSTRSRQNRSNRNNFVDDNDNIDNNNQQ